MTEIGPGTQLGSYRLTEPVGQGGMGVVWKGEHVETGQVCAVKLLTTELADQEGFRERFKREAAYASSLQHPNVIACYDAGAHDGVLFMAMQFVQGTDLKALLAERGRLDPPEAVEILSQVASALDAAHATGLLHRDVKPGNIMIEPGEPPRCYLTDFGLSKNPSQDSFALTAAGSFVGTIDYTAPEQILAKPFDHRVDVYSLACVLYEALTGEVPYPKTREVEVLYGHIQDPPPRLTVKRPDVPQELEEVIVKAMAKDPDERYPSASALMDAAREAIGAPAAAVAPTKAPPPASGDGSQRLRVVTGLAEGAELTVDGEFLIGRHADDEAGKLGKDPELSRRHAMVRAEAGGALSIEDLGSTNGTFVNGTRIAERTVLSPGDRVEIGDSCLEVVEAAAPPPTATVFADVVSSTPPAAPAQEVDQPLPPVAEDEVPQPPEGDLTPPPPPDTSEAPVQQPPAAARGRVVLRVEVDLDSGALDVGVEEGPGVRIVQDGTGRWTIEQSG